MNPNFERCLQQNKIYLAHGIEKFVGRELAAAQNDLEAAQRNFQAADYKWCTTQAYYAMFHAGRALLYSKGYKERSHYCLLIALEALFVEKKKIKAGCLINLRRARELREFADYSLEFSQESAAAILSAAEEFIAEARQAAGE